MSEKISRRVFLKATGLAALSVAAAGAFAGCSLSPLPGNATLPSVDDDAYQTVTGSSNSYEIAFTSLSDQWESLSTYESDSTPHRYIYAGLYIRGANSDFTLRKSSIQCTIGGKTAKVAGLGNVALNSDATRYQFPSELKVSAGSTVGVPLYIDLGDNTLSSLTGAPITITVKAVKTVTVDYVTPSDQTPTVTVS